MLLTTLGAVAWRVLSVSNFCIAHLLADSLSLNFITTTSHLGVRSDAVGWGTALQAREGHVIGIFHWRNPSGRTVALRSTQPLTEMGTRGISWGVKVAGA